MKLKRMYKEMLIYAFVFVYHLASQDNFELALLIDHALKSLVHHRVPELFIVASADEQPYLKALNFFKDFDTIVE